jgi:hypothetical protein
VLSGAILRSGLRNLPTSKMPGFPAGETGKPGMLVVLIPGTGRSGGYRVSAAVMDAA